MRSTTTLAWRNLTGHPLRSVLTALAIALGVAMVLAASIVGRAASQSADTLADMGPQIALELMSRSGGGFDQAILDRLRALPGVERVVHSLRVEAEGVRPPISRLVLLGVDPETYPALHDLVLANGAFLDRPDSVVLPMGLAIEHSLYVGNELELHNPDTGRTVTLTVSGRLKAEEGMEALSGEEYNAFVPLAVAQTLAGMPGQIDLVEIGLHPGTDMEQAREDVAQVAGPDLAVVRAATGGGIMGNVLLVQFALAIVGMIILLAAGFVILNAFAMSVTGRMREIGALRALGMARRQVLGTVLVEACLLGLVGTAAGMGTGLGLAWGVMYGVGPFSMQDTPFLVPWWGLTLSALMGLGVTLVSALLPARRASRISPISAARAETPTSAEWYVRPQGAGRVGAVLLGLIVVGLLVFGLLARPNIPVALPVMLLSQAGLLGATVLLLPALVDPVIALCRPLLVRRLGTAGRLAVDNLARNKLRTVLTTGALAAGLTIIVATSGLMTASLKGSVSRVRSGAQEDGFVTADLSALVSSQQLTFDNFFEFITSDDLGFDLNPVAESLTPLVRDGLIQVNRYRFQIVPPELSAVPGVPGLFVDPEVYLGVGNFDFFEGDLETALAWMQRGRALLVTPIVAERLGAQVGDEVPVQTPHGEVPFTVAGIGGGGFLMTVLPYADGEAYFDVTKPSFLGIVVTERHAGRKEAVLEQVSEAIQPFPEVTLLDYDESLDPVLQIADRLALLLDGLLLLAVIVAALGVVNTMVINVAERQREIALLRAVGATQRQVRQAVVAEAVTLGLLAALVATGLGLLMLLTWGILVLPGGTASVGVRADWETIRLTMGAGLRDWGIASVVSLLFGPLVAGVAAYYPARQAAAIDVAEATRSERLVLRRTRARPYVEPLGPLISPLDWKMTWRSLAAHRARTILSALAIALGVAMIVATGAVNSGVRAGWASGENVMAWVSDLIDVVFTGVGTIILAAAGFLIYNALAMAVTQQQRQIGILRSLGMTRRQVMRQILLEALATGGLGVLIGLVAGPLFGRGILFWMERLGLEVGKGKVSTASMALGVALGLGITLLSALIPANRATRVSPLAALREREPTGQASTVKRRLAPTIAGSILLLALMVYLVIAPPGKWAGQNPPWEWIMWLALWGVWFLGGMLVLPTLVDGITRLARALVSRLESPIGRLLVDNLERSPRRVTLTVLSFAIGVMAIVGIGGVLAFSNGVLVTRTAERMLRQIGWYVYPFDRTAALAQLSDMDIEAMVLDREVIEEVRDVAAGRANVGEVYLVSVPEISAPIPGFPSFIESPDILARPNGVRFNQGDWETALPIMQAGCGLLVPPGVAARHKAEVGDVLTVQGLRGPVPCTIAGIGVGEFVPVSIISLKARDAFVPADQAPASLSVYPLPGTDIEALEADLYALADRHGDNAWISKPKDEVNAILDTSDQLQAMFNGLSLLAQVAAALGTINTTLMSVIERRRELGLLRAVGMARKQVRALVGGEAALLGVVGAGLGLVAGVGMGCIFGLAYGGISFGLVDLPLWRAAGETVLPAIQSGWIGLIAAPLLAGGSALPALRLVLRGSPVETLEGRAPSPVPAQHPLRRRARKPSGRKGLRSLAFRNLQQHPLRTTLSALAVALGVMMVVAADVTGSAVTSLGEQMEESQSTAGILGAQLEMWLGAVGLVILAVAAFLVFNAFAMSVTQRRRQIGVLRSLGMTRRQVMRTVLVEALLTGTAGTVLGLVAGPLVGRGLVVLLGEFAGIASDKSPPSPGNMLLAAALGMGITLLSIILPARRATRISPLAAIRDQARAFGSETRFFTKTRFLGALGLIAVVVYLAVAPPALYIPPAEGAQIGWHDVLTGVCALLWLGSLALILPALIAGLGRWVRAPLSRLWGATGRLIADNLGRDRGRVTLTILTLAISVMMIVSITGALGLLTQSMLSYYTSKQIPPRWGLFAGDETILPSGDLASWQLVSELDLSAFGVTDELYAEIEDAFGARANILEVRAAIVPVIDVVPGSMSFLLDAQRMRRMALFDFYEGDWDTAQSIMEEGCGLLITPGLARRHGVWLYDTLDLPGKDGTVECTVAGLGLSANFGASLIGDTAADRFNVPERPFGLFIQPHPDVDVAAFEADIDAFVEDHDNVYHMDLRDADDFMETMVSSMLAMLNGPLLLAIAAAALGVINTTAMSVAERRHELGLLRAVGAMRRQARAVVMGEAALMGVVGGLLGLLAGGGLAAILVLAGDHSTWGLRDLVIRDLLSRVVRAAVINGLAGTVAAPFICAVAAWLPARAILRGTAIETMDARRIETNPKGLRRPLGFRGLQFLAWRNVSQHRTRTVLSALAVALGVAMTVAADVTSSAIMNAIAGSEDARIIMTGLLDQLDMMLTLIGVGITMAAGFLVFNAFAMSVTQRRRLIGVLRSLGMTRRQVMRTVVYEAAITGGLGTLLGLIVGPILGRGTMALIKAFTGESTFAFEASGAASANLLLAACLGLGITLLSVLIPARRATRVSPLTALRQEISSDVGVRYASPLQWIGLAVATALFAYLAIAPPGEWVTSPWDTLLSAALTGVWLICVGLIAPGLIGGLGQWAKKPLARLWGATGRLIADNLRRGRGRVLLTILTLAVGLALIVGTTGFISFMFELLSPTIEGSIQLGAWLVSELDFVSGMSAYAGVESLAMSPEVIAEIKGSLGEGARTMQWHFTVVPELSFFGSTYFSFIMDPYDVRGAGNVFFTFIEGSWETAMPAMQQGCGVLVSPAIANQNGVSLGDTIEVTGADGPVPCTVAGIGTPYVGASIIGVAARDAFDVTDPLALLVWPAPGTDRGVLEAELTQLVDRLSLAMHPLEDLVEMQTQVTDMLPNLFSALLLLAILAAALGVVNTTTISIAERRQELGLLRAVGATRRQVGAVVAGEAALMGLVGGALGLAAGIGVVLVVGVTYGGNAWGMPDLDLWPAAWRASGSAMVSGILGLIAAPFICAGAAWLPTRSILRGTAIETMEPERQTRVALRRVSRGTARGGTRLVDLFCLGSIRMRFVLGTALLLLIVLAGLIGVVTRHERTYMEDQMGEMLLTMVEGQAGMIELTLPDGAQTIDLASLQAGQFDADELLRFRALMDDVSEHGLEEFVVADRDNVVVLSLDARDMGTMTDTDSHRAYPKELDEPWTAFERAGGEWRLYAAAPIRNEEDFIIGSVQTTINLAEGEEFIRQTRETLWLLGGGLAIAGLALSWALTTPVVATTQQLTQHAARIARGEYAPIPRRPQSILSRAVSWLVDRTSLRLRLTVAMLLVVALLVGVLETAVVPIERHHVERTLKDGMLGAAEWMSRLFSESFDLEQADMSLDQLSDLDEMLALAEDVDLAKLQELGEELQSRDVAYVALVDQDGVIQISDQLSLVGETAPVPSEARIEQDRWRDEDIWVLSTPLYQGRGGEQIGALRFGLRRETVEAFLTETRNLFRLTGVIAALASVLLAQVVGSAVTAPVRQLASGVRRVGAGDLDVQFQVRTRDELAMLARAFNEMTAGLREREWLRDMFGRFVSHEVAEAIRTGQVRLEGENRVVSVLFCDIRDFTRRSSLHTPEQMVALLNEYLPVVVQAAQHHAGTVNKFGGDSTLIIYGAPRKLQESAYRAVQTALEIRASLQVLNARLTMQGQESIRIGVGINTGVALAGAVGPEARQEYTVIGDTVNLASRIEALNKEYPKYDILISGWTYEALGTRRREYQFVDMGEIPIRGKSEPVRVWAVVGGNAQSNRSVAYLSTIVV